MPDQDGDNIEDQDGEIGGLFKKVSREQQRVQMDKANLNLTESTLIMPWSNLVTDWLTPQVCIL